MTIPSLELRSPIVLCPNSATHISLSYLLILIEFQRRMFLLSAVKYFCSFCFRAQSARVDELQFFVANCWCTHYNIYPLIDKTLHQACCVFGPILSDFCVHKIVLKIHTLLKNWNLLFWLSPRQFNPKMFSMKFPVLYS
jgi:hypothetical protein